MSTQDQKTILLVEDQAATVAIVSRQLQKFGYSVITANTGEEAVELATGDIQPDLILMDIMLGGGIDGAEAAKQILTKRNIPIVFLSSHSDRETVEMVRGISRYGYVLKKSDEFVLQSTIEMALDLFETKGQLLDEVYERKRAEELVEKRINTLTQPLLAEGTIALEDLFRLDEIQRIQDEFALATGVASIITHPDGTPFTAPSNFTYLCSEIIRKTEQGCANCFTSDAAIGRYNPDGPIVQQCLSGGLWDAGASITVGGKHVANWLIGQVRNEAQTDEDMRSYARTIGADEAAFMDAYQAVPVMPRERFELIARTVHTLANQLSTIAFQNVQQARFIAQCKRNEAELQETKGILEVALAQSPSGILIADAPNVTISFANPAATALLGGSNRPSTASGENLLPLHWQTFRPDGSQYPRETLPLTRAVVQGETTRDEDVIIRDERGDDHWAIVNAAPIRNADGQVIAGIVIFHDITERKHAEEALRETESRFQSIFEQAAVGVAQMETETGRFIRVNKKFSDLLGYTQEEMQQIDFMTITHPDNLLNDLLHIDRLKKGEIREYSIEKQYICKNGSLIWVNLTVSAMWTPGAAPDYHIAIVQDITERKQVGEALSISEERLRRAQKIAHVGNWELDLCTKIIWASEDAFRIYGVERTIEYLPLPIVQHAVLPEYRSILNLALEKLIVHNQKYDLEFKIIRANDGRVRFIHSQAEVVYDQKGAAIKVNGILQDITERKISEDALRESEAKHSSMVANISDVIGIIGIDGMMKYKSPNIGKWFGWQSDDLIGTDGWLTVHPDDLERIQKEFFTIIQKENSSTIVEYRYLCKDGSYKPIELTAVNLVNDPLINGVLMNYHDITERKQAENELQKRTDQFSQLLQTTDQGIYGIDMDGHCTFINRSGLSILGYQLEECVGMDMHDLIHHSHADGSAYAVKDCPIFRAKATGLGYHVDNEVLWRKDGSSFPAEYSSHPYRENGEVCGAVVTFADITDRKHAEDALRESENRFSLFMDYLPAIVFLKDNEGRALYVNKYMDNALSASQWLGKTMFDVFPNEFGEKLVADDMRILSSGYEKIEESIPHNDGKLHDYETQKFIIDRPGQKPLLGGIAIDITDRKRAEEAIRESEARHKSVIAVSNTGAWEYHKDTDYLWCSPEYFSMLGYNHVEFEMSGKANLKEAWTDLLHPEDREEAANHFVEYLNNGSVGMYENYFRFRHKGGAWNWIWSRGQTLRNKDGELTNLTVGVHIDITERKRAEENLRQIETRLLQSEKMDAIGQLAGGIAHDFNNVLGGIIGYTDMSLNHTEKGSMLEGNLFKVLKAADRAKNLVKQILAFSRQGNPQKLVTTLRPIIEEVLDLLRSSIPSSVIIESDLHEGTKPVLADPTQIHQVILNLATNAVHAMNRKGVLTVKLCSTVVEHKQHGQSGDIEPGEYTIIEVGDTGCGMDASTLSKAFEPFFTTKAVGEGTGMGLSVVLGIVQSHGGDLQVESQVGKGTVIKIYLPVSGATVSDKPNTASRVPLYGDERILFVDDEVILVEMAEKILIPLGYTVTGISDSLAALNYIKDMSHEIDLLITDQTMPGLTGMELAQEALKIRKRLPIILCTGYSREVNAEMTAAMGINLLVMKPYAAQEISRAIREVVDSSKVE